jgi:mRNA interferase MazF
VIRGDVYRVRFADTKGHEQHGSRLAVIVQADEMMGLSTVLVAPTSRNALAATFRPQIDVAGEITRVLVEQLRAVDPGRLGDRVGHLAAAEQRSLDAALETILGL